MLEDHYQLTEIGEKIAKTHLFFLDKSKTDQEKIVFLKSMKEEGYLADSSNKFSLDTQKFKYEPKNFVFESQEVVQKRNNQLKEQYGVIGPRERKALNFVSIQDNFKPSINQYAGFVIQKKKVARVKLVLEVDVREKRNRGEAHNFFAERLKRAGLKVELSQLPIGDFLWTIEIEDIHGNTHKCVTDYIIERKKVDDLAQSIQDGRYYDQKNRLKISGLKKVIYLVEGEKSPHCQLTDKTLESAIASTRCFHRFLVNRTENPQDSLNFMVSMHGKIKKIIDSQLAEFSFPATREEFINQQKRSDTMTVGKIFTSMMSTLKGFGPETIARMNESFSSMRELYEFMQRQDNYTEKLNFIDSLNQK